MKTGMLWYDDDKDRTLGEKVNLAAKRYRAKYGQAPTLCLVNPRTMSGGPERVSGIELRSAHNVLVHHFWLGAADAAGG